MGLSFKPECSTLSTADADTDECSLTATGLKLFECAEDEASSGCAHWMAQRNGAPSGVELFGGDFA